MESRVTENSAKTESRVTENLVNEESQVTQHSSNAEHRIRQDLEGKDPEVRKDATPSRRPAPWWCLRCITKTQKQTTKDASKRVSQKEGRRARLLV
jgi:hypothetical protein